MTAAYRPAGGHADTGCLGCFHVLVQAGAPVRRFRPHVVTAPGCDCLRAWGESWAGAGEPVFVNVRVGVAVMLGAPAAVAGRPQRVTGSCHFHLYRGEYL